AQYAVEARSELGGLDLLAVSLAHRVEEVGKDDAPFQENDLSVELQKGGREIFPAHVEEVPVEVPEKPLITEVVDGKEGGDPREEGVLPVEGVEESGHEGGLPVVAVDHVGHEARCPYRLQDALREEDEALGIVYVIAVLRAVEVVPVIVFVIVLEVDGDGVRSALHDVDVHRP